MINKAKCEEIIDFAIKHARGRVDGLEVAVDGSNIATSRFAVNGMTQNQSPDCVSVSVRAIQGGRQARQSTEDITTKGVREVVDNAIAASAMLEPDGELLPLPDKKLLKQFQSQAPKVAPSRFDAKTCKLTAADRALQIRGMIDVAKAHGLESSGVYASGTFFNAFGNSNGLFQFHRETSAESSVTMEGANSSGWAKHHATSASQFDAVDLAKQAASIAARGINPREMAPGRYKAILPPSAVLDLLAFLFPDFSATSHIDQVSSLTGKLGKRVFGNNISIVDDAYHALQAGEHFDGEGLPRSQVNLIENGVLSGLVRSRISARTLKGQATGHSLPQPSAEGESPSNLVMLGGDTSVDQMIGMIRGAERAVLLTRVWYVRTVDPETVLLTGMTRDGTFCVENGEVSYPIRNFRFNVSVHEMLNKVLALGPSVRASGEESSPQVVPAMLVDDFNFTEVTKF